MTSDEPKKNIMWRALAAFTENPVGASLYKAAGPLANALVGTTQTPRLGDIPWTPFSRRLAECRVALVSTAGFHLATDRPFDIDAKQGDPSFRVIPMEADPATLAISHVHYPHRYAEQDPNVLLPLDRLRELGDEGVFKLAPRCYSFGFAGTLTGALVDAPSGTAQQVADRLRDDGADILLVAPA